MQSTAFKFCQGLFVFYFLFFIFCFSALTDIGFSVVKATLIRSKDLSKIHCPQKQYYISRIFCGRICSAAPQFVGCMGTGHSFCLQKWRYLTYLNFKRMTYWQIGVNYTARKNNTIFREFSVVTFVWLLLSLLATWGRATAFACKSEECLWQDWINYFKMQFPKRAEKPFMGV